MWPEGMDRAKTPHPRDPPAIKTNERIGEDGGQQSKARAEAARRREAEGSRSGKPVKDLRAAARRLSIPARDIRNYCLCFSLTRRGRCCRLPVFIPPIGPAATLVHPVPLSLSLSFFFYPLRAARSPSRRSFFCRLREEASTLPRFPPFLLESSPPPRRSNFFVPRFLGRAAAPRTRETHTIAHRRRRRRRR